MLIKTKLLLWGNARVSNCVMGLLRNINIPVCMKFNLALFIQCEGDEMVPLEMANRLKEASNIPADLWVLEGGEHTRAIHVNQELYTEKIVSFFNNNLIS